MPVVSPESTFSFNKQDYEFIVRIYNGVNDIRLNSSAWEDLFLEEDIFDWKLKGSIVVRSEYEIFERASEQAEVVTNVPKSNLVYKFRNDCRDTIFITIKPLPPPPIKGLEDAGQVNFQDKIWRIELEGVIFDVQDLPNEGVDKKRKKLFFWEKTYQLMLEKDSEYSTSDTGSNAGTNNTQTGNSQKSLPSVESLGELLKSDEDFNVHAKLVGTPEWETGDSSKKIFFSSPIGSKFIDNLNYLLNYTLSSAEDDNQPCILKFERAEQSMMPKQFSLKSIKKYFQKAGNQLNTPGDFQNEHFFIYTSSDDKQGLAIQKAPLDRSGRINVNRETKGDNTNTIRGYQLVDVSGLDYSMNLTDYKVVSYNSTSGQFNIEGNKHKAEEYKKFFAESIRPNVITRNASDRLILTPFILQGKNTKTVISLRNDEVSRLADGRNRLLKYYLFANLAITFDVEGSTKRQTGRFFAVSKLTDNAEEYDHKLEGQYFVTNIIHHFNNSDNSYMSRIIGVKTHTYEETTGFTSSNVSIINPELSNETISEQESSQNSQNVEGESTPTNNPNPESPTTPTDTPTSRGWKPPTSESSPLPVEADEGLIQGDLFPTLPDGTPTDNSDLLPPTGDPIERIYGSQAPANQDYLELPNTPGRPDLQLLTPPTQNTRIQNLPNRPLLPEIRTEVPWYQRAESGLPFWQEYPEFISGDDFKPRPPKT